MDCEQAFCTQGYSPSSRNDLILLPVSDEASLTCALSTELCVFSLAHFKSAAELGMIARAEWRSGGCLMLMSVV